VVGELRDRVARERLGLVLDHVGQPHRRANEIFEVVGNDTKELILSLVLMQQGAGAFGQLLLLCAQPVGQPERVVVKRDARRAACFRRVAACHFERIQRLLQHAERPFPLRYQRSKEEARKRQRDDEQLKLQDRRRVALAVQHERGPEIDNQHT